MANPSKILRKVIKRLRASGSTWQDVADELGFRNRGQAYMIATGRWEPTEERTKQIIARLPARFLWHGRDELDSFVLSLLKLGGRLTGRKLARLLGTKDRTIRGSVKRLREAGHKINGSMGPPRGYLLEEG